MKVKDETGSVVALVALFLPIAVLTVGIVVDLGFVFTARKCVQSACDLGALAGIQQLDWDELAQGNVVVKEEESKQEATEILRANLNNVEPLIHGVAVNVYVRNDLAKTEPRLTVECSFKVKSYFLRWLPGMKNGVPLEVLSEAAVMERKEW